MPRQPIHSGPVHIVTANVLLTPAEFARFDRLLARTRKSRRTLVADALLAYLRQHEPEAGEPAAEPAPKPAPTINI